MKLSLETGSLVVLEKKKRGPKFRFTKNQEEKLGKLVSENPEINTFRLRYSCVSTHRLLLCGSPSLVGFYR